MSLQHSFKAKGRAPQRFTQPNNRVPADIMLWVSPRQYYAISQKFRASGAGIKYNARTHHTAQTNGVRRKQAATWLNGGINKRRRKIRRRKLCDPA